MSLSIARTFDADLVNSIMSHPSIYPYISDDMSPCSDEYDCSDLIGSHSVFFLAPMVDDKVAGVFLYHPLNGITYEVHTCILPEFRGDNVVDMAKMSLLWMFDNTACLKVITHVPENNMAAYRLSKNAGLRQEGINRASFLKNDNVLNQYVLGITKGEMICQQQQ